VQLRPYQEEAVSLTWKCWGQYDRLLGVSPTGAGKTVIASAVIQARLPEGPALFLAHRDELLSQALAKLRRATGIVASREQAGKGTDVSPFWSNSLLDLVYKDVFQDHQYAASLEIRLADPEGTIRQSLVWTSSQRSIAQYL